MSESASKRRKIYVDHPKDISKPKCLMHGPGHSSDKCRVFGDFCSKYDIIRPTKYLGNNNANRFF